MSLDETLLKLNTLKDSLQEFDQNDLSELSGINPIEMDKFQKWWESLNELHKLNLIQKINQIAEENFELEFYEILYFTLSDKNPNIRKESLNGLWECEDYRIGDAASKILLEDKEESVRVEASKLLRNFCYLIKNGKISGRISEKIINSINFVLANISMDSELWRRTLESTACFNTQSINHYIKKAYNSQNIMLTSSAVYAMGETDNVEWLNTVITETYNDSPEIRYESAIALGKLGNEAVLPNIKELLNDEDIQVQNCAIESLGIIGGPIAKKMLLSLPNDMPEIQQSLELALENLES
tara:strand:- start:1060 stop:1956 length:897 start_codon:yes stop_codon:yes gene_type:complete